MRHPIVVGLCVTMGTALCLLAAWLVGPASAEEEPVTLEVAAKRIPLPTTVSPELRKVIAAPVPRLDPPETAEAWRKLQRERDATAAEGARALAKALGATIRPTKVDGVSCYRIVPKDLAPENGRRLLVHCHGGAYVFNAGEACLTEALLVAHACKTPVLSVDYRMPPDHPFPAALEDAVAVWKGVHPQHGAANTALFGTSAGGGLVMATVLRLKELGVPLPGALFVGTPWTDLTKTGDSYFTNAEIDNVLGRYEGLLHDAARLYANGKDLSNPLISPVGGNVSDFPPTILITGTRDLFLSNTIRTHRRLRQAGVQADLHV